MLSPRFIHFENNPLKILHCGRCSVLLETVHYHIHLERMIDVMFGNVNLTHDGLEFNLYLKTAVEKSGRKTFINFASSGINYYQGAALGLSGL
ncbi:hypothetical protein MPTK1_Vg00330 [Marchantia polymorpha subsp. ruderalis]|uniref:Uncharacterized protein n=1 Tax=Marchantia polymorpha TaxID=3197 RepID=A0A2R6VWT6_MARPO|nr:hypothetical protein MARPO_YB0020 [Marchantia polymorpha]BBN20487.1 hypothetical protein Mp_Vg00330 [Marchantia polymorpha subsp. ruderalis]|eukprot:PTQ26070.1 hypothetical protein MARPO_YB0020 [Marchantia polymorpha]